MMIRWVVKCSVSVRNLRVMHVNSLYGPELPHPACKVEHMLCISCGMSQKQEMSVFCSALGQSLALSGKHDLIHPRRSGTAAAFSATPLRQRKAVRRQHARRQGPAVVAQAAATAEAALKTDLHGDLKKALANVKPKVSNDVIWQHAPCGSLLEQLACQPSIAYCPEP